MKITGDANEANSNRNGQYVVKKGEFLNQHPFWESENSAIWYLKNHGKSTAGQWVITDKADLGKNHYSIGTTATEGGSCPTHVEWKWFGKKNGLEGWNGQDIEVKGASGV